MRSRGASAPASIRRRFLRASAAGPVIALFTVLSVSMTPRAPSAVAQDDAVVRMLPERANLEVGQRVDFAIRVDDIAELYGADVRVSFDPAVLAVEDADPVREGVQIELVADLLSPDWVLQQSADNEVGSIWYAVTQLHPREEASGSGALARFTFLAVGGGESPVTIDYRKLTRRDGTPIDTAIADALVTVVGVATTPPVGPSPSATSTRPSEPTPSASAEPGLSWDIMLPLLARNR